jgi:pimeloyl-ACP methyl ester carboxylesterase
MEMRTVGRFLTRASIGVAVILVIMAGVGLASFQRDMRAARARVDGSESQMVDTACGPIEYAIAGEGPPVLAVHGAGGGYDQGLLLGRMLIDDGYQVIAPSRFGYLNSPIPADASLEAQADAFACLLDELDIEKVAVVGFSAGGPPSLQFALSYPERTTALVLGAAISTPGASNTETNQSDTTRNAFIASDLAYWLALTLARPKLVEVLGVTLEVQARLTPEEAAQVDEILEAMLPMSARLEGIGVDQRNVDALDLSLEDISAPTLVFHALDDTLIPYVNGQHSAESIPSARLVTLEDGGHLLVGHREELLSETTAFLETQLSETGGWE